MNKNEPPSYSLLLDIGEVMFEEHSLSLYEHVLASRLVNLLRTHVMGK